MLDLAYLGFRPDDHQARGIAESLDLIIRKGHNVGGCIQRYGRRYEGWMASQHNGKSVSTYCIGDRFDEVKSGLAAGLIKRMTDEGILNPTGLGPRGQGVAV